MPEPQEPSVRKPRALTLPRSRWLLLLLVLISFLPVLVLAACAATKPAPRAPLVGAGAPPGSDPIAAVLERSRQASGGEAWSGVTFLEQRSQLSAAGLQGELTLLEDVRDGRARTQFKLGPITGGEGFDGQVRWRLDPGGEVVVEDSPDALARRKTTTWIARHGYFSVSGATFRMLGTRTDARTSVASAPPLTVTALEATPEGGHPIELWFDEATGHLVRTAHLEGTHTIVTYLEDYRAIAGGVKIPFRVVIDSGDPRNLLSIAVTAAAPAVAGPEAFARPDAATDHLSFTGAASQTRATELPFELINNHIYIRALVNGQPVRLLVDTGGISLLTRAAVVRLGLTADGNLAGSGAGAQQVDVGFARGKTLQVGELAVRDPLFYVYDFAELLRVEGVEFDGLVGFELFHRFAVRIDYAKGVLRLSDPARFIAPTGAPTGSPASPGVIAVPFVLNERTPLVEGEIDGVPARFTIDTGSRASLTAASPFVAKHGLVARYRPRFETVTGWGVGGPVSSSPVRFAQVKVGGAVLRGVLGDLYTGDKGAFADPRADANLGGGVLRRFTVSFDYGKRIMYLEPNASAAAADPYDRAGMFLIHEKQAGGGFARGPLEIAAVTPGSPAERAGLRAGDLIMTIDGANVRHARSLAEWRAVFRDGAVGAKHELIIVRGKVKKRVQLTLADLVP